MNIRIYHPSDRDKLVELFAHTLETNASYISHGEIQMGLSHDGLTLTPDFKEKWIKYLERQNSEHQTFVYVCEVDASVAGFVIFGIEEDADLPYGVIYDIVVTDKLKGTGAADKLYQYAIDYFKSANINDCYIESGLNNHRAHRFFERRGFSHVSNIYRLTDITK